MDSTIIVALISGGMSLLGVVVTNAAAARRSETRISTAQAVTDTKLDALTQEVRTHNNFAIRIPVLEEQLRAANERIEKLENELNEK